MIDRPKLPQLTPEQIELVLEYYGPHRGTIMLGLVISTLVYVAFGFTLGAIVFSP